MILNRYNSEQKGKSSEENKEPDEDNWTWIEKSNLIKNLFQVLVYN